MSGWKMNRTADRSLTAAAIMAAGITLTAGLTLGTAETVWAAESGWTSDNGTWRYVDSSGSYVTNQWKTSGGASYYLGGDGSMAVSSWIDGTYYVDEDGAMVKNSWIQVTESGGTKEEGWYYMGSNGKLTEDGWATVGDAKYCFDSDGKMRTGWYYEDDNTYYLGEDGAMKTGWLCLAYDEDEEPEEGDISTVYSSAGDDAKWFYFQTNGKAKKADGDGYVTMTVDSKKYYFDGNGVMMTGWQAINDAESGDAVGISKFVYLGSEDQGWMAKSQWKELSEHPGDSDDEDEISGADSDEAPQEGDSVWYYFVSDGTPAYLKTTASTMSAATAKVSGESYFFDQYGVMKSGLIKITSGSTELVGYFGSSDADGKMRTGKQTGIYDDAGEKYTFYFNTSGSAKGSGYTGEKDGYLYYNGILVEAEDGTDYEAFEVDGDMYLVNESGKVQTSSKAYKSDGNYAYRISGGTLYYTDDDGDIDSEVTSGGTLPSFECNEEYDL